MLTLLAPGSPGRRFFPMVVSGHRPLPSYGVKVILESSKQQAGRRKENGIATTYHLVLKMPPIPSARIALVRTSPMTIKVLGNVVPSWAGASRHRGRTV